MKTKKTKTFKDLLKKADMSGAQLARRVGVTTQAVSYWCSGKTSPPYDKLPDIARYLGVTVDEVVRIFIEVKKKV